MKFYRNERIEEIAEATVAYSYLLEIRTYSIP